MKEAAITRLLEDDMNKKERKAYEPESEGQTEARREVEEASLEFLRKFHAELIRDGVIDPHNYEEMLELYMMELDYEQDSNS